MRVCLEPGMIKDSDTGFRAIKSALNLTGKEFIYTAVSSQFNIKTKKAWIRVLLLCLCMMVLCKKANLRMTSKLESGQLLLKMELSN